MPPCHSRASPAEHEAKSAAEGPIVGTRQHVETRPKAKIRRAVRSLGGLPHERHASSRLSYHLPSLNKGTEPEQRPSLSKGGNTNKTRLHVFELRDQHRLLRRRQVGNGATIEVQSGTLQRCLRILCTVYQRLRDVSPGPYRGQAPKTSPKAYAVGLSWR